MMFLDLKKKGVFNFLFILLHERIDPCLQGCGNTMPDLSDVVPFHPGQVENFYLLVLGQVQMY